MGINVLSGCAVPGYGVAGMPPAALDRALPARIHSGGRELRRGEGYDWHGLRRGQRGFALLQLCLTGEGRLAYEGEQRVVLPGQAMVLAFPHDHRYWLPSGGKWEFVWIILAGEALLPIWRRCAARCRGLIDLTDEDPVPQMLAQAVVALQGGLWQQPWDNSRLAWSLATHLAGRLLGTQPEGTGPLATSRAWALRRLDRAVDVTALAAQAGLSRAHYSRLFAATYGQAPAAWLRDQRLAAAVRLLSDRRLGLEDIAQQVGLCDGHHLGRLFRRRYGMSPGAWRRAGLA